MKIKDQMEHTQRLSALKKHNLAPLHALFPNQRTNPGVRRIYGIWPARQRKKDGYLRNDQVPVVVVTSDPTEERRGGVTSDPTGRNVVKGGEQVIYRLVAKQAKSEQPEKGKSKPKQA
ncbi:hypothetical protein KFK09_003292 [Dendrobium nobile]|uniref:Uncharacterized protein n=1 Tax=Dendrobium nobile TaxID=94219 RepID=A0A8T3C3Q0_DENNO|nr:hypothetical protein KFK09_003292 [Dendrobium nobile]